MRSFRPRRTVTDRFRPAVGRLVLAGAALLGPACASAPEPVTAVRASTDPTCPVDVLVTFHSRDGSTAQMARAVAEGAESVAAARVTLARVEAVEHDALLEAEAIVVGSPVYNGNVTPEVQEFLNSWPFEGRPLADRIGAAFVSAGGFSAGEEGALAAIQRSMLIFGLAVVGGEGWESALGASAVVDEAHYRGASAVDDHFLAKARGLGARVARYAEDHYCAPGERSTTP